MSNTDSRATSSLDGAQINKIESAPSLSDDKNDENVYSFLGYKGEKLHLMVAFMCGVGFLLFGYDQGVMGSLLTLPTFNSTFPDIAVDKGQSSTSSRATYQGFVVAVYELGCMVSALSTIYLGDMLGRKLLVFVGGLIMLVGGILQATAFSTPHLIVARVVSGLGNGFITSTVPVWQSELSKAESRGKLICIHGALITAGIAISYWIDFAFYFTDKFGSVSWRFPIAFQCIFPIIIMPFVLRLPESPRWLMRKGRVHDARKVFSALDDLPANDPLVQEQLDEIQGAINMENKLSSNGFQFKLLLTQGKKKHFHRLCLAGCAQWMQQISGINLITYYAGTIFETYIGLSPLNSRILAACNGTEYFLAALIPIFFIDKIGRRPLLLIGATGQCVSMVVLTISAYYANHNGHNTQAAIAAAVFLFVFNTFFGLAFLAEMWLLPPELTSIEIRAPSAAISTACNWISNFLIVMITPPAFNNIGAFTYTIFAVINFLMIPVLYFLYPETKGRSLEEMDTIFAMTPVSQPWKVVSIAKNLPYNHVGFHQDHEERLEVSLSEEKPTIEHGENI